MKSQRREDSKLEEREDQPERKWVSPWGPALPLPVLGVHVHGEHGDRGLCHITRQRSRKLRPGDGRVVELINATRAAVCVKMLRARQQRLHLFPSSF